MEARRVPLPYFRAPRSKTVATTWSVLTSTWTLGAVVFIVTWGGGVVAPVPSNIDHSAGAGLNLALVQSLDFGSDVVWSYGPLGFVKSYVVFYAWPARLAALYGIVLHLGLSLSLVWAARRSFPLLVAFALALVAAMLLRGDLAATEARDDAAVIVLAFIWCVAALAQGSPSWVRRLVLLGGGPFAALELLAKTNTGVVVLVLVTATVLALDGDRRRNAAILAAGFLGTLAALWFASGQGLDGVWPFIRGSWEIAAGYSSGARTLSETRDYDYVLGPAVIAVVAAVAWISTRTSPMPGRAVALAMFALVAFVTFKAGFVRHDLQHMATFYATFLGVCLAFRLPRVPAVRFGAAIATAGIAAACFTTEFARYPLTDPIENVRNGASSVATLVDTGRLEDTIADHRADARAAYALDARTLELLEGRTVHVHPTETAVVWAHELDWRPLPVFQPYAAWTEELDRGNAEALAADDGPERILRQTPDSGLTALGHYPGFESPSAMIEMLCHYRPLHTTESWQVLGRIPDRCGEPRPLGAEEGTYGEPITVPRAPRGGVVFATVGGVQVSGLEALTTLLERARERRVGFAGDPSTYLLIPTTAEDDLLLRAPAETDFPEPFAIAPNADEISFLLDGGPAEDRITIDFFSMPVRPVGESGRRADD
jgi:hypothetical protein